MCTRARILQLIEVLQNQVIQRRIAIPQRFEKQLQHVKIKLINFIQSLDAILQLRMLHHLLSEQLSTAKPPPQRIRAACSKW